MAARPPTDPPAGPPSVPPAGLAVPSLGGRELQSGPLIVTEDDELIDALLKLCVAAGATPHVVCGALPPRQAWEAAKLVLVGVDVAEGMAALTRRPGVLLVGADLDDAAVWQKAVAIGAEHVVFLPDSEPWLLDRVADAAEGVGAPALAVAVMGAAASTLACALAVTAAREGHRTVLVDVDPLGGRLDVLLGGEEAVGLRWPDLASSRGRGNAVELEQSLPRLHRLAALGPRGHVHHPRRGGAHRARRREAARGSGDPRSAAPDRRRGGGGPGAGRSGPAGGAG
jgi:secretion/DNA translocation related CpaE-like protein